MTGTQTLKQSFEINASTSKSIITLFQILSLECLVCANYQIPWRVVHDLDADVPAQLRSVQWLQVNPVKPDPILVDVRATPLDQYFVDPYNNNKNQSKLFLFF